MEQKTKFLKALDNIENIILKRPVASTGILMLCICSVLKICGILSVESIVLAWLVLTLIGWFLLFLCMVNHTSTKEK